MILSAICCERNHTEAQKLYTWFETHGEAKVDDLERGDLRCIGVKEVLRLKVPVHDTVHMAMLQKGCVRIVSIVSPSCLHDKCGSINLFDIYAVAYFWKMVIYSEFRSLFLCITFVSCEPHGAKILSNDFHAF
jgi:hypothetical protein